MAIKNIEELEKFVKLEEGQSLKALMESEDEVSIELDGTLKVRTAEDEEAFVNNLKTEFKKAGEEIAVKEVRNELGLEFQGKTVKNLANALSEKVKADTLAEAKIEPDAKIQELTADKEALVSKNQELTNQVSALTQEKNNIESGFKLDTALKSKMAADSLLSKEDRLDLFKKRYNPSYNEEGQLLLHKDGQVMKNDTTRDPIGLDEVMSDFDKAYLKEVKPAGGNGGGDDPAGGGGSDQMESFTKEMKAAGHEPGSLEFAQEMNKRLTNGTLKV